jgi:hypothetical protein
MAAHIVGDHDMKRAWLAVLALAGASGCDRITPVEATRTAMGETFARIALYAETNKSIPRSLEVLPQRARYANKTTDGWGRLLQYDLSEEGIITLRSYGADGKPGGLGEDADISVSYHSKRPDGSLWVGSPMWIVEAEIHPQLDGAASGSQPVRSDTNRTSAAAGPGR